MRLSQRLRKKRRRGKKEPIDLDITSLLDILVIMLVFLLKSYNASGIILNVPKGLELPKSESQSINTSGVMIQVTPETIYVDDQVILDTKNLPRRTYDHNGRRIIPLYNELVRKKDLVKQIKRTSKEATKFTGVANLILDKSLKYSYIKKIMYTCAAAGYKTYKFVVLGEE